MYPRDKSVHKTILTILLLLLCQSGMTKTMVSVFHPVVPNKNLTGEKKISSDTYNTYLQTMGVSFPEGSTLSFSKESGGLIVRNTRGNHEKIHYYLNTNGVKYGHVFLTFRILSYSNKQLERILSSTPNTQQVQQQILSLGEGGKLLQKTAVMAQTSNEKTTSVSFALPNESNDFTTPFVIEATPVISDDKRRVSLSVEIKQNTQGDKVNKFTGDQIRYHPLNGFQGEVHLLDNTPGLLASIPDSSGRNQLFAFVTCTVIPTQFTAFDQLGLKSVTE